ncbi:MAG: alpha/beta fold hydrolase [Acidobacteria bacterium]|nr:MAG: alpha/beta fold hydrolase [Acidobacteriota bacterium]
MERPFEVPAELYPFRSRWQVVGGLPVHYVDEGEGPPVLFLHGNPTWSFLYRDVIRELRGSCRSIALDYPGMGMSGKPRLHGRPDYGFTPEEHSRVVEGFVEALDLHDLTLMVQDWGGPIGLAVAARQRRRVARLVIANTWGWPAEELDMKIFSFLLGRFPGPLLIRYRNFFVETVLPLGVEKKERLTPAVMAAYRAPYAAPVDRRPTAVFPRAIVASRAFLADVEAGLESLRQLPAAIIWAKKDKAFRKRELERWRALFPAAPLTLIPDAGHYLQEDAPQAIAAAVRSFLGLPG